MNERMQRMLAEADERFQNVSPEGDGVPAGSYLFQLQSAKLIEKEQDDGTVKLMIHWEHQILEGEYAGEVVHDFSHPAHKKNYPLRLLKQRLTKFGETDYSLNDIEEIVARIANAAPSYTGIVRVSKGFRNVEIQRIQEDGEPMVAPASLPAQSPPAAAPVDVPADPDRAALIALCERHDLAGFDDEWSLQDVVTAMKQAVMDGDVKFDAADLISGEATLLVKHGLVVMPAPKPKKAVKESAKKVTKRKGKKH